MTSTHNRRLARSIQHANPGMNYTEALRRAKKGVTPTDDLGHYGRLGAPDTPLKPSPVSPFIPLWFLTTKIAQTFEQSIEDVLPRPPLVDPAILNLPAGSNLLVAGPAASGCSVALHHLAQVAALTGWQVSILDARDGEYDALRAHHPRVETLRGAREDTPTSFNQAERRAFLAHIAPGTSERPCLVIVDDADYAVIDDSVSTSADDSAWRDNVERLLANPHTVVAVRTQRLSRTTYGDVGEHLDVRLMMGRQSGPEMRAVLCEVAPPDVLKDFDDSDYWPEVHDVGRGTLWDGHDLHAVQVARPGWLAE